MKMATGTRPSDSKLEMSAAAFSSSEEVISRKVNCISQVTRDEDLVETYEIKQCTEWLSRNCFSNIALQFPDKLLVDAPKIANTLQKTLPNAHVFILGDTSYGSCCVDEVGAQHYKADCIVHYGHACLSPTTRLPVFYVFDKSSIDISDCVSKVQQNYTEKARQTILVYDTSYVHVIEKLFTELLVFVPQLIISSLHIADNVAMGHFFGRTSQSVLRTECEECSSNLKSDEYTRHSVIQRCGRVIHLTENTDINECNILFLGNNESTTLISLMMTFNKCSFFVYDPQSQNFELTDMNVNKALMKRYYLVERAKDSNIVGIVVGTLGVARYKEIIDHLKVLIKKAGKKSYTFVIGKLNPAKLANFAEVDIYVLVSCLESSLLEQRDFYRPVVTPFEMEIACNKARQWNGEYTSEFATLLPGSDMHVEAPPESEYVGEADVSLISNRIRVLGHKDTPEISESDTKELVTRSDAMAVAGVAENAGEFFAMRSWKGLEKQLGETPVVKASEGRKGIALSYENENLQSVNK